MVLDNIQELIDDFALDGLRINKACYYLPPDEGGLGLIHIGTFLMAQKCSWVKRTHSQTIDNWRLRLKLGCPNFDVTLLKKCDFDNRCNPILYNIAKPTNYFLTVTVKSARTTVSSPFLQILLLFGQKMTLVCWTLIFLEKNFTMIIGISLEN
jgi:hypothetical protein